jgi:diaminopimelate decarboxylase
LNRELPAVTPQADLNVEVEDLRKERMQIRYFDLEGGLGISYQEEEPPHPVGYAVNIAEEIKGFSCILILEPGRVIVGNARILISKVLYTMENEEKRLVIVDTGMNDLVRRSYYCSYHQSLPVKEGSREELVANVIYPIGELNDFLARGGGSQSSI